MRAMMIAALGAAWLVSASTGSAQTVMEHGQALKPTIAPAQIPSGSEYECSLSYATPTSSGPTAPPSGIVKKR